MGIIKRAHEETAMKNVASEPNPHPASERASLLPFWFTHPFWAAGNQWLSALSHGKLAYALSAAGTDAAKLELLVASAEADITKVRAAEKETLLAAAAAELAR